MLNHVPNEIIKEILLYMGFKKVILMKSLNKKYNKLVDIYIVKYTMTKTFSLNPYHWQKFAIKRWSYNNFSLNCINGLDIIDSYFQVDPTIINNKKLIKHAINKTCERRLEYLLEAGLDPNSTTIMDDDYVDEIPLLFYIIRHKCGFKSYFFDWSIETLLRYGANFKFKDFEGDTMLHFIIGDKKLRYFFYSYRNWWDACLVSLVYFYYILMQATNYLLFE